MFRNLAHHRPYRSLIQKTETNKQTKLNKKEIYPLEGIEFILAMPHYQMAQSSGSETVEMRAAERF